jgi:hypothetical protein
VIFGTMPKGVREIALPFHLLSQSGQRRRRRFFILFSMILFLNPRRAKRAGKKMLGDFAWNPWDSESRAPGFHTFSGSAQRFFLNVFLDPKKKRFLYTLAGRVVGAATHALTPPPGQRVRISQPGIPRSQHRRSSLCLLLVVWDLSAPPITPRIRWNYPRSGAALLSGPFAGAT